MSMDETQIDYDGLVADAMRGVIRTVLTNVLKHGLPGEHHFYVSFNTCAPGVVLSKRLKERYPEEMTIVLQHRFWDLAVHADRFEVKLAFNSIPERIVIPYAAIKLFVDPSVRFGHQFDDPSRDDAPVDLEAPNSSGKLVAGDFRRGGRGGPRPLGEGPALVQPDKKRASGVKKRTEKTADTSELTAADENGQPLEALPASTEPATPTVALTKPTLVESAPTSAKVVSLDQFRKK
jgi:uncharacterized protein